MIYIIWFTDLPYSLLVGGSIKPWLVCLFINPWTRFLGALNSSFTRSRDEKLQCIVPYNTSLSHHCAFQFKKVYTISRSCSRTAPHLMISLIVCVKSCAKRYLTREREQLSLWKFSLLRSGTKTVFNVGILTWLSSSVLNLPKHTVKGTKTQMEVQNTKIRF